MITPVFVILTLIALMSFILFGKGVCDDFDGEKIVTAIVLMFVCVICFGIRQESIERSAENKRKYDLCVKEGKEVTIVLDAKVCKL